MKSDDHGAETQNQTFLLGTNQFQAQRITFFHSKSFFHFLSCHSALPNFDSRR